MTRPIDRHIATIRELDVAGHETARRERMRLRALEVQYTVADLAPARKAGEQIKRYVRRALDPHRVEFRREDVGFTMFYAPARLSVLLHVEVWPRLPGATGGYKIPARPIISGSIGARNGDELDRLLAAIKVGADALAEALFGGEG